MTCGRSGVAMGNLWILLAASGVMAAVIGCLTLLNNRYTLNNIKSKTVGDGQHGTAISTASPHWWIRTMCIAL